MEDYKSIRNFVNHIRYTSYNELKLLAYYALKKQDMSNEYLVIIGESAIDIIIDKNALIGRPDIPFDSITVTGLTTNFTYTRTIDARNSIITYIELIVQKLNDALPGFVTIFDNIKINISNTIQKHYNNGEMDNYGLEPDEIYNKNVRKFFKITYKDYKEYAQIMIEYKGLLIPIFTVSMKMGYNYETFMYFDIPVLVPKSILVNCGGMISEALEKIFVEQLSKNNGQNLFFLDLISEIEYDTNIIQQYKNVDKVILESNEIVSRTLKLYIKESRIETNMKINAIISLEPKISKAFYNIYNDLTVIPSDIDVYYITNNPYHSYPNKEDYQVGTKFQVDKFMITVYKITGISKKYIPRIELLYRIKLKSTDRNKFMLINESDILIKSKTKFVITGNSFINIKLNNTFSQVLCIDLEINNELSFCDKLLGILNGGCGDAIIPSLENELLEIHVRNPASNVRNEMDALTAQINSRWLSLSPEKQTEIKERYPYLAGIGNVSIVDKALSTFSSNKDAEIDAVLGNGTLLLGGLVGAMSFKKLIIYVIIIYIIYYIYTTAQIIFYKKI